MLVFHIILDKLSAERKHFLCSSHYLRSSCFFVPIRFDREPLRVMNEIDEHVAAPSGHFAAPTGPDLSRAANPQTGAALRAAGRLSVRLLEERERDRDVAVVSARGEVDLETAPALREVLELALEHQTGPVVVDLSEVAFMDSTGVHVLVDTLQRLTLEHRRLAIACREGGQVHRLLDLVGLLDVLPVHRSRKSAVFGGNDLLRPESRRNRPPSAPRAVIQNPSSINPATGHAAPAS